MNDVVQLAAGEVLSCGVLVQLDIVLTDMQPRAYLPTLPASHNHSLGKITVELFKKPAAEAEAAASDYVDIVTFDGTKSTSYTFHDLNDPVRRLECLE